MDPKRSNPDQRTNDLAFIKKNFYIFYRNNSYKRTFKSFEPQNREGLY